MIERFNRHYIQKFLNKIVMVSADEFAAGSLAFEQRHNSSYRYSKLGGRTPNTVLALSAKRIGFPETEEIPVSFNQDKA